jgi:hypothetical protein
MPRKIMFRPEVQYINLGKLGKLLIIGYNRTHVGKQGRFHQQDCQNLLIVKPRFVALRAVYPFYRTVLAPIIRNRFSPFNTKTFLR